MIKITYLFIVGSILLCFPQNEKAFLAGIFLVGVLANCISSTNLTGRARKIFTVKSFHIKIEFFWISIVMPLGGKMIAFVGGLLSVSFNVSCLLYNLVKILYEQDSTNFRKSLIAISCFTMLRVKKMINLKISNN